MRKPKKAKPVEVRAELPFTVHESAFFLRQLLADVKLSDGTKLEVSFNIAGHSILVTVTPKGLNGWRTYVLSLKSLIRVVLSLEDDAAEIQAAPINGLKGSDA